MSWQNLDWLDVHVWDYDTALNDRVRQTYLAAHSVLDKAFLATKHRYEEEMSSAQREADMETADQQLMYAGIRWHEQTRALAAMALTLLSSVNKSFLDSVKSLFDKTHEPDPKGYPGKSQLQKQIAEYKARFDVDLETTKGFETVREVDLGRNCCLHAEGGLSDDYREQTEQRLVGVDGRINLTPELLDVLLLELAEFSRALSVKMKAFRAKATGAPTPM